MLKGNIMKFAYFAVVFALFIGSANAQLKNQIDEQQSVSQSMLRPLSAQSLLGLFDPNKFSMHQSISMSYLSAAGSGVSLASYTNSMAYQLADPLNLRMDLTLQGQPFGTGSGIYSGTNLSKLFISRAELNYKAADNMFISFRFRQMPYSQWMMSDPFQMNKSSLIFGQADTEF